MRLKDCVQCSIVRRVNRFAVEVEIDGKKVVAHLNNTGRLREYIVKGKAGLCVQTNTGFRLAAVEDGTAYAVVDTRLQMKFFEELVESNRLNWMRGAKILGRNKRLGNSLIDYLLQWRNEELYLEIKSAVLREGRVAMYPDCPTERGRKHIAELTAHVKRGGNGAIVFMAALPRIVAFRPNSVADPEIHRLLLKARNEGVMIKAVGFYLQPKNYSFKLYNSDLRVLL